MAFTIWSSGQAAAQTKMNNPSGRSAGSASSLRAGFGGVIYNGVGVGSSGASETDLLNQSIAANVLSVDQYYLEIEAWILFANNANSKRIRSYFGATLFFDTTAAWQNTWGQFQARIYRTGAATEQVWGALYVGGATSPVNVNEAGATETLSGAVTYRVTGTATTNNDIALSQWRIKWFPLADT